MKQFWPGYLQKYKAGDLEVRTRLLLGKLKACSLCPWRCRVDRIAGERGQCKTARLARVHSFMPHHGEERPLRGHGGSGTIFFSGCNLHCVYCQNSDISQGNYGSEVEAEKIADMMISLQDWGCHNINLVSPTHVVPQIFEALLIATNRGLNLPLVYNTGGYDSLSTLKLLDGIIDIYMPDMKYAQPSTASRYSGVNDYPIINQLAVKEMHRQVGDLIINDQGYAQRGLLIRHLLLPGQLEATKNILQFIYKEISKDTYVNIMSQYRPEYQANLFPEINFPIKKSAYDEAIRYAHEIGLHRLD